MKSFVKAISNPKHAFFVLAKRYIKYYENFSYNFKKNGEEQLLQKLSDFNLKVVFDVRANIGEWTKIASKFIPKADLHCFEMVPETFSTLSKNLNKSKANLSKFFLLFS